MCLSYKSVRLFPFVSFLLFAYTATVYATPINYGNLNAVNVVYQQITEDSTTDPTPLFGAPSVAGDALLFSPVSFGASASGAGGIDLTDGTLATTIVALNNSRIENVQFAERGDYTLFGNGTVNTAATVSAALFVRIIEVEGIGISPVAFSANMTFTPSGGTYNLINDPGVGVIWQGGIVLDINAALAQAGVLGKATKVDLSLDNTLAVMSETGTVAFIKKKQVEGVSITTIVSEPSTFALLGIGAFGLFTYAWRSRKQ